MLNKLNYPIWKYTIRRYEAEHDMTEVLSKEDKQVIPGPAPEHRNKRVAQASRLITFTISQDILTQLGYALLTQTRTGILSMIDDLFKGEATPETHERHLLKAQEMTFKPRESLEDYIARHMNIRNEMTRANYPSISLEQTTI